MSKIDIRIGLWNANGLTQRKHESEIFLNVNQIDVFLISETHFTDKSYFNITGYTTLCINHPDNKAH